MTLGKVYQGMVWNANRDWGDLFPGPNRDGFIAAVSAIGSATVGDAIDMHRASTIINFIEDAVLANTGTPLVEPDEFLYAAVPRVGFEST